MLNKVEHHLPRRFSTNEVDPDVTILYQEQPLARAHLLAKAASRITVHYLPTTCVSLSWSMMVWTYACYGTWDGTTNFHFFDWWSTIYFSLDMDYYSIHFRETSIVGLVGWRWREDNLLLWEIWYYLVYDNYGKMLGREMLTHISR